MIRRAAALLVLALLGCGVKAPPKPPIRKATEGTPAKGAPAAAPAPGEEREDEAPAEAPGCENGCAEPSTAATTTR